MKQPSGKHEAVLFRFDCNKHLNHAVTQFTFISLRLSEWARAYYRQQRARGHEHWHTLRALGAKWLKIIFVMWRDRVMYDEERHLATTARQMFRQTARHPWNSNSHSNIGLDTIIESLL